MDELYRMNRQQEARWISFENPTGGKGSGALTNKGQKGNAFERLDAGETKVLMDFEGSGIIRRMWMTISDRSPAMLRSIRIDIFWDGSEQPAVSVPLGDFFCAGLGIIVPFENELFSSPEGRSFNAYIPMPFRTRAVVTLTNESEKSLNHLFYDINFSKTLKPDEDLLYFHAYWRRENRTSLGLDYAVLPCVSGMGRFLGMSLGVATDPRYMGSWWGEGEVKLYMDGDREHPTLVGTGTEDYIGTAWGQGTFAHRYQGCLVWNKDTNYGSFYRFHIPDPIFFHSQCRVDIQQIGGAPKEIVGQFAERGVRFRVVTADAGGMLIRFLDDSCTLTWEDEAIENKTWLNFQREDDVSSIAYFYLDRPENGLPALPAVAARTVDLPQA